MQKRYLPVAIVTGILALLALVGYMLPEQQGKVPRRILMENTGGAVVFQHAAHADKLKIPCEICHHESPEAREDVRPCKSCHGVVFDAAFKKNHVTAITDNASCVTCHHYELKRKKWGHDRHHQEIGVDCRFCHHENTDIEPEPQNCADCHEQGMPTGGKAEQSVPPNMADAVHARCMTCHDDLFAKGARGCVACHGKVETRAKAVTAGRISLDPNYTNCAVCHKEAPQKLMLGSMDAYHKLCMGCHAKLNKGPHGKEQCAQCHTSK